MMTKVDAARAAVERLANVQMNISLAEWSELSSTILAALSSPASSSPAEAEALQAGVEAVAKARREMRDCILGLTVALPSQVAEWRALLSSAPAQEDGSEDRSSTTIPRDPSAGRYLAETRDGRLLYLNHADQWQEMPNILRPSDLPLEPTHEMQVAVNLAVGCPNFLGQIWAACLSALPRLRRVRHLRRGTEYEVLGEAEVQVSSGDLREGDTVTVYRSLTDGRLWARPVEEFEDGRFVTLHPSPDRA